MRIPNVSKFIKNFPFTEFLCWVEFYKREPWGSLQDDRRIGVLSALTANINTSPRHRSKSFEPKDFFPLLETRKVDKTATLEGWKSWKKWIKEVWSKKPIQSK